MENLLFLGVPILKHTTVCWLSGLTVLHNCKIQCLFASFLAWLIDGYRICKTKTNNKKRIYIHEIRIENLYALINIPVNGIELLFSERFYLDALERIDGDISRQLEDIESKVRWKGRFKVSGDKNLKPVSLDCYRPAYSLRKLADKNKNTKNTVHLNVTYFCH